MTKLTPKQFNDIRQASNTGSIVRRDLRTYLSLIIEPYDRVWWLTPLEGIIFGLAEFEGYRGDKSLLDIAEEWDVNSRYRITRDELLEASVSRALWKVKHEDIFGYSPGRITLV